MDTNKFRKLLQGFPQGTAKLFNKYDLGRAGTLFETFLLKLTCFIQGNRPKEQIQ